MSFSKSFVAAFFLFSATVFAQQSIVSKLGVKGVADSGGPGKANMLVKTDASGLIDDSFLPDPYTGHTRMDGRVYVSKSGHDGSSGQDGSVIQPYQTVRHALSELSSEDFMEVVLCSSPAVSDLADIEIKRGNITFSGVPGVSLPWVSSTNENLELTLNGVGIENFTAPTTSEERIAKVYLRNGGWIGNVANKASAKLRIFSDSSAETGCIPSDLLSGAPGIEFSVELDASDIGVDKSWWWGSSGGTVAEAIDRLGRRFLEGSEDGQLPVWTAGGWSWTSGYEPYEVTKTLILGLVDNMDFVDWTSLRNDYKTWANTMAWVSDQNFVTVSGLSGYDYVNRSDFNASSNALKAWVNENYYNKSSVVGAVLGSSALRTKIQDVSGPVATNVLWSLWPSEEEGEVVIPETALYNSFSSHVARIAIEVASSEPGSSASSGLSLDDVIPYDSSSTSTSKLYSVGTMNANFAKSAELTSVSNKVDDLHAYVHGSVADDIEGLQDDVENLGEAIDNIDAGLPASPIDGNPENGYQIDVFSLFPYSVLFSAGVTSKVYFVDKYATATNLDYARSITGLSVATNTGPNKRLVLSSGSFGDGFELYGAKDGGAGRLHLGAHTELYSQKSVNSYGGTSNTVAGGLVYIHSANGFCITNDEGGYIGTTLENGDLNIKHGGIIDISSTAGDVILNGDGGVFLGSGDTEMYVSADGIHLNPENGTSGVYIGNESLSNRFAFTNADRRAEYETFMFDSYGINLMYEGDSVDFDTHDVPTWKGSDLATVEYVDELVGASSSEMPGLVYDFDNDGNKWVVEYSGEDQHVVIPKYSGGNEVFGISATATGFGQVTSVLMLAKSVGIIEDNDGASSQLHSAFLENGNLQQFVWVNQHATFFAENDGAERHFFDRTLYDADGTDDDFVSGGAFCYCTNLHTFVAPWLKDIPTQCFQFTSNLVNVVVPSVENIGSGAFYESKIGKFVSHRIKKLYPGAFMRCGDLETVIMTSPVELESYAFENCGALDTVYMPCVKKIGYKAFAGCSSAYFGQDVVWPYLEEIGSRAFEPYGEGPGIGPGIDTTTLTIANARTILSLPVNIRQLYADSAEKVMTLCKHDSASSPKYVNLEVIKLGKIKKIPRYFAYNHPSLTRVILPSVEHVGRLAFSGCRNLAIVEMPNVISLESGVFRGDSMIKSAKFEKLRSAGGGAFSGTSISSATASTFPKLEICGPGLFSGCRSLQYITLPSARHIGHSLCGAKHANSFWYPVATNVRTISLPKAMTIGGSMAANCSNLVHFYAPNVVSMGGYMIANTPCNTSGSVYDPSDGTYRQYGLSFPSLQKCSTYAFAFATNATEFSAPGLASAGSCGRFLKSVTVEGTTTSVWTNWGGAWIGGAWTNIYVPSLPTYNSLMTRGSTSLSNFTYAGSFRSQSLPVFVDLDVERALDGDDDAIYDYTIKPYIGTSQWFTNSANYGVVLHMPKSNPKKPETLVVSFMALPGSSERIRFGVDNVSFPFSLENAPWELVHHTGDNYSNRNRTYEIEFKSPIGSDMWTYIRCTDF